MNKDLDYLYQRYIEGTCTEEERITVLNFFAENPEDAQVRDLLDDTWNSITPELIQPLRNPEAMLSQIVQTPEIPVKKMVWYRYAVAASILLAIGTALFFYTYRNSAVDNIAKTANHISPGGNKATLTLANGTVIALDNAVKGEIARQAGIVITKTKTGQLIYNVSDKQNLPATAYNTISTPRGGQYEINLPDGTKIWLNAASSLKYPASFSGKQRRVQLSGEAYFEVAKDKAHPFIVATDKQEIQVLGTHFNINSYTDEELTKTTLLEGSVKVSLLNSNRFNAILKPGEQAVLSNNRVNVYAVDTQESVAWKNGYFQFSEASLETIMKQISRWYDVDVSFEGKPSTDPFHFKIPRNLNLDEVLKIFETNGINFKIEGRKLIVRS